MVNKAQSVEKCRLLQTNQIIKFNGLKSDINSTFIIIWLNSTISSVKRSLLFSTDRTLLTTSYAPDGSIYQIIIFDFIWLGSCEQLWPRSNPIEKISPNAGHLWPIILMTGPFSDLEGSIWFWCRTSGIVRNIKIKNRTN